MDLKFTSIVLNNWTFVSYYRTDVLAEYKNDGRLNDSNELREVSHPLQEVLRSYFNFLRIAPYRTCLRFMNVKWTYLASFVRWLNENKFDKNKSMLRGANIQLFLTDDRYIGKG